MNPKRNLAPAAAELITVLLLTAAAFTWGQRIALAERGYDARGGEYLLLLFPVLYYTGKRVILDWIAYIQEQKGG